jgi:radical SAM superfamily enzyme YgiQ (UPF0313 family)
MIEKEIDVLLVNPTRVGVDSYCTPPLHLMYLKRALNDEGYSVHIVNVHEMYCKEIGTFENYERSLDLKKIVEQNAIAEILGWDAKLIGIGGVCPSYEFSEKLVIQIKLKKDVPIIVGGSLGLPLKDLWFRNTKVDYLCEADGERVIVDIMKNLSNKKVLRKVPGLYWRTDDGWEGNSPDLPRDLDYIAVPKLRDIDYEFYMDVERKWVNKTLPANLQLKEHERVFPVIFTRGCIYNCLFCFHFSRKHRKHSIEYIIDYLSRLKKEIGATVVITWDDLIMANPKWFMSLCDALENACLGIKIFTSGGKANLITEEMANKMFKANFFRISFGIESGSQTILDEMQKKCTVEDNRRAIKVAAEVGLFVHANIVLGMPSETKDTLSETFNFLVDVVKENGLSMKNISCAFATGYPGTQLFDYMVDNKMVSDMRDYILSVKGVGDPDPVICSLSKKDLQEFVTKLNFKVNDIYFARQDRNLKRILNFITCNNYSRAVGENAPPKIKDIVRKIVQ